MAECLARRRGLGCSSLAKRDRGAGARVCGTAHLRKRPAAAPAARVVRRLRNTAPSLVVSSEPWPSGKACARGVRAGRAGRSLPARRAAGRASSWSGPSRTCETHAHRASMALPGCDGVHARVAAAAADARGVARRGGLPGWR